MRIGPFKTSNREPGSAVNSAEVEFHIAEQVDIGGFSMDTPFYGIAKEYEVLTLSAGTVFDMDDVTAYAKYKSGSGDPAEGTLKEVRIQVQYPGITDPNSIPSTVNLDNIVEYRYDEGSTDGNLTTNGGIYAGHLDEIRLQQPHEWKNFKVVRSVSASIELHITLRTDQDPA